MSAIAPDSPLVSGELQVFRWVRRDTETGWWQRVGFSRSLVEDRVLLYFGDESTSAIDADTVRTVEVARDRAVDHYRRKWKASSMTLAHEYSRATRASMIIVMSEGKIEAVGNHEELISTSDVYRGLLGRPDTCRRNAGA